MKKILLFSVVFLLAGISTIAQEKTPSKNNKAAVALKQPEVTKGPSELEQRTAAKQLEVQNRKAPGTDTKFTKAPAVKAVPVKKN